MHPNFSTQSNSDGGNAVLPDSETNDVVAHALGWQPRWLDRSPCLEHLPFLSWLVQVAAPELAVSLGVGQGAAYFALCQSATKKEGVQFYGIDLWRPQTDSTTAEHVPAIIPKALTEHNDEYYGEFSRLICSDPSDAADFFDLGDVDLLLVEQALSPPVLDTVESAWIPQMSKRGIIILTGTADVADSMAKDRLQTFKDAHPHIEFSHDGGIVVVFAGSPPAPLKILAESLAMPGKGPRIAQQLSAIGGILTNRMKVLESKNTMRGLRDRIEKEREARKADAGRIKAAEKLLNAEKAQADDLRTKYAELTQRLAEREAGTSRLETEKNKSVEACVELERDVAAKKAELRASEKTIAAMREESAISAAAIDALRGEFAKKIGAYDKKWADQSVKLAAATEQCDSLIKGFKTAQESVAIMEAQYASVKTQVLAREEALATMWAQRSEAVRASELIQESATRAQAEVTDLTARLADARHESDKLRTEMAELIAQRDAALKERTTELEKALSQKDEAVDEVMATRGALIAIQSERAETTDRLHAAEQRLGDAQKEQEALRLALDGKISELEVARAHLSDALEKCVMRESALAGMADRLNKLDRQRANLENDVAMKINEIVSLTRMCEDFLSKAAQPREKRSPKASA